jgi:hypothetical protein
MVQHSLAHKATEIAARTHRVGRASSAMSTCCAASLFVGAVAWASAVVIVVQSSVIA